MSRSICPICAKHPVALNYYRNSKAYYRTACTGCIHRQRQKLPQVPGWLRAGYKKQARCDRCGFSFKVSDQSLVYYVDGDLNNNRWRNLKTICLNCSAEVKKIKWKPSNLVPDF